MRRTGAPAIVSSLSESAFAWRRADGRLTLDGCCRAAVRSTTIVGATDDDGDTSAVAAGVATEFNVQRFMSNMDCMDMVAGAVPLTGAVAGVANVVEGRGNSLGMLKAIDEFVAIAVAVVPFWNGFNAGRFRWKLVRSDSFVKDAGAADDGVCDAFGCLFGASGVVVS